MGQKREEASTGASSSLLAQWAPGAELAYRTSGVGTESSPGRGMTSSGDQVQLKAVTGAGSCALRCDP